jgi:predicted transcriptional regulator
MTLFQIRLSPQQSKALKACARARRRSCHAVVVSALAQVLAPYVAKQQDDARAATVSAKRDLETGTVMNDLELDSAEDQLLRRLAGLPPAPE